jgi:hypothetical protein
MSAMVASENLMVDEPGLEHGWRQLAACRGMESVIFFESTFALLDSVVPAALTTL